MNVWIDDVQMSDIGKFLSDAAAAACALVECVLIVAGGSPWAPLSMF